MRMTTCIKPIRCCLPHRASAPTWAKCVSSLAQECRARHAQCVLQYATQPVPARTTVLHLPSRSAHQLPVRSRPIQIGRAEESGPGGYCAKIGQPRYRKGVRGPMQLGDPRASTANLDYHDGVSKQRDMAFTAVRHRPSNMAKMSPKRGIDDIPSADKMKEAR